MGKGIKRKDGYPLPTCGYDKGQERVPRLKGARLGEILRMPQDDKAFPVLRHVFIAPQASNNGNRNFKRPFGVDRKVPTNPVWGQFVDSAA